MLMKTNLPLRYLFCLLLIMMHSGTCGQMESFQSLALPAELTSNAHAVVRLDRMIVEILSRSEMRVSSRRVVTVLDETGNKSLKNYLWYNPSIKIKKLQAVVYNMLGTEIRKIKEKEFTDVSAVDGGTLYSDSRVKYLNYTPVQYPYTMELTYEYETANTGLLPSWYFIGDYGVGTEKSHFEIRFSSPELQPECRELNFEGRQITKETGSGYMVYRASNIIPIKNENLSPPFASLVPMVKTRMVNFFYEGYEGQITDWKTLGWWISENLLKGQDDLPESTVAKARWLVRNMEDPVEKARVIYEYIQQNTRYISVQIGIGGLKPISAIEVDKMKYGDCKGLSNYTKALLEAVGVNAYYVHVEAGKEKVNFMEDFPDLAQGNHAILAVSDGKDLHWIDCTSQTIPFGFLGDFTDDRKVLVMTPDGGELMYTPAYEDEDNYQQTVARIVLDTEGAISGQVKIATRGIQYNNHYHLESESAEDRQKYYKRYWRDINNLDLTSVTFTNDSKAIEFTEDITLQASGFASKSGNLMLFGPNAFNRFTSVPERNRDRSLPLDIPRGFLDEDSFTIQLPGEYQLESLPGPMNIETEFGTYRVNTAYDSQNHSIGYTRSLLVREGRYPANLYEAYWEFCKSVARGDGAQVVLVKSSG